MDQRIEAFLADVLALAGELAIAGAVIVLTGHWATTDNMIADLIAGLLMLAFGVTVLLMWSFRR
jgi:hypothetical protein